MRHFSNKGCRACTTNEDGTVRAIVDPHACEDTCRCQCHALWAELRRANQPIGTPSGA